MAKSTSKQTKAKTARRTTSTKSSSAKPKAKTTATKSKAKTAAKVQAKTSQTVKKGNAGAARTKATKAAPAKKTSTNTAAKKAAKKTAAKKASTRTATQKATKTTTAKKASTAGASRKTTAKKGSAVTKTKASVKRSPKTQKRRGAQKAAATKKNKGKIGLFGLVTYGLTEMVPIAPFAIFASVFLLSNGMPALAYLIAAVAMLFTVLSFGVMIPLFPSSGSIYTYAAKTITPAVGFIAGWLMLLQYLLTPDLMFIQAGQALNQYIPSIPEWTWCLVFLAFVALVSLCVLKDTIRLDKVALVAELIVFGLFIFFTIRYLIAHPSSTSVSFEQFFNARRFDLSALMNSVSLCALSFVGFGCVATVTQQAKNPKKDPEKAMLIMVLVLAVMFIAMSFLATCLDPKEALMKDYPNTGFYILAGRVGGRWFGIVCAVANALALGVFNGLVSTTAIARVISVMSNSGALPKFLSKTNKKNVPILATICVNVLSFGLLFVLIRFFKMSEVVKLSNFGALATYCILNICVFWYCFIRKKKKLNFVRAALFPALGAFITGWIFFSIDPKIALIGWIWVLIGLIYYVIKTRIMKVKIKFN